MPSPLTDGISLAPPSSFAFLQSPYSTWESSLANSRSLTEVNGASVHPLLRVNRAGWQLPVTLSDESTTEAMRMKRTTNRRPGSVSFLRFIVFPFAIISKNESSVCPIWSSLLSTEVGDGIAQRGI
jgi:hypothetical protein